MKYVYVVYDKTDRNYKKPFMYICRNEEKAIERVEELRSTVSKHAQCLINYEIVTLW